jgi:hypothetical protein
MRREQTLYEKAAAGAAALTSKFLGVGDRTVASQCGSLPSAGADGSGLGVAQLDAGAGAGSGDGVIAAGLGAADFFLAGLFLATFFGAAFADFFALFFEAFFADFAADFLAFFADFLAAFFVDFFADFFFAVTAFLAFLAFLLFLLFFALAIVVLLLPLVVVGSRYPSSDSNSPLAAAPIAQFNPGDAT